VIRLHEGLGVAILKVRVIMGDTLGTVSVEVAWAYMVYVPGSNLLKAAVGIARHGPLPEKAQ
jgi:hypothetical protein